MPRPDFRSQAAERLATERSDYTPALIDLLQPAEPSPPGAAKDVRRMPIDRVAANPDNPRRTFDEEALVDLAASIREHGVLQPVLVAADSASATLQLICTSPTYQPLSPSVPVTLGVTSGAVASVNQVLGAGSLR